MTNYEVSNPENKKDSENLSKRQLNFHKNCFQEYDANLLHNDDYVRIRSASTLSQLHQKEKAGNKRLIFINFFPKIFKYYITESVCITKVFY